jgi:hypothetical protein
VFRQSIPENCDITETSSDDDIDVRETDAKKAPKYQLLEYIVNTQPPADIVDKVKAHDKCSNNCLWPTEMSIDLKSVAARKIIRSPYIIPMEYGWKREVHVSGTFMFNVQLIFSDYHHRNAIG